MPETRLGARVEQVFLRCSWEKDIPGREKVCGWGARGVEVRVVMQRDESISVLCIWETENSL